MPAACLVNPRDSPRWLTLQIGSLVPIRDLSTYSNAAPMTIDDRYNMTVWMHFRPFLGFLARRSSSERTSSG
jgi:hypothetical protein